jgi:hypothetical protein
MWQAFGILSTVGLIAGSCGIVKSFLYMHRRKQDNELVIVTPFEVPLRVGVAWLTPWEM